MEVFVALLCVLGGIFTVVCACKEYEFFMGHRKAQTLIRIIGYTATKYFYLTLGILLLLAGIFLLIYGVPAETEAQLAPR